MKNKRTIDALFDSIKEQEKADNCNHKPKYCMRTGGSRCRKCNVLLNDFGKPYQKFVTTYYA